jgi:enoyl-CoA hydratase
MSDAPTAAEQEEPPVLTERLGEHILLVTLNRPRVRNAVNGAVAQALDAVVRQTEADPSVWVVILTGAGRDSFCAGGDLKEIAAGRTASFRTEFGFAGFVFAPRQKVWIAALNGPALGGGCELMLACDLAVASQGARIGLPEVMRGVMAGAGGVWRLARSLPRALALEMIATGRQLSAQEALDLHLVNAVAPADDLIAEARRLAEKICAASPLAVQFSLQVARQTYDNTEAQSRELTQSLRDKLILTSDYKEGPRAFNEKRPPRWEGV